MDLIANILKMYSEGDGHVEVLTASVRGLEQMYWPQSHSARTFSQPPFEVLKSWSEEGTAPRPGPGYKYAPPGP